MAAAGATLLGMVTLVWATRNYGGKQQAKVMAATQGPIKASAFGEPVSTAAWKTKPSWFVVSNHDRMILPALQHQMAKRIGAKVTDLQTSHVPQQSQPEAVARVILDAVASVK